MQDIYEGVWDDSCLKSVTIIYNTLEWNIIFNKIEVIVHSTFYFNP